MTGDEFTDDPMNFTYVQLSNSNAYEILFSAGNSLYMLLPGSDGFSKVDACSVILDSDIIHSVVAVNSSIGVEVIADEDIDMYYGDLSATTPPIPLSTDLAELDEINEFWKIWQVSMPSGQP